jgi:uncharacterized protein YaiI (UPF0178 family)
VLRASRRRDLPVVFVANRAISPHRSPRVSSLRVGREMDAADAAIAKGVEPGDLVVTADIPLAAKVVSRGGQALDPRGDVLTEENVGERLAMRDLLSGLRADGGLTGGPPPFSNTDRQRFANALDRMLTAAQRRERS